MRRKVSVLITIVVLIISLYGCSGSKDNGLFINIKWGTPIEDVQKILQEKYTDQTINIDNNKTCSVMTEDYIIEGAFGFTVYNCGEDTNVLNDVRILVSTKDCTEAADEILDIYRNKLEKLYGKSTEELPDYKAYKWDKKNITATLQELDTDMFFITVAPSR